MLTDTFQFLYLAIIYSAIFNFLNYLILIVPAYIIALHSKHNHFPNGSYGLISHLGNP